MPAAAVLRVVGGIGPSGMTALYWECRAGQCWLSCFGGGDRQFEVLVSVLCSTGLRVFSC